MNTTVYFTRHTIALEKPIIELVTDTFQVSNEKAIASIKGEKLALKMSELEELANIDVLYSSNYGRALCAAKYIADKNNIPIIINEALGERKFGIESWKGFPENFFDKQYEDENYKLGNGESRKMVQERMNKCIDYILSNNRGKRISIVTHSTALVFYLMQYMNVSKENGLFYNDKKISDYEIPNCGTIKVIYNENNEIINVSPVELEVQPLIEGDIESVVESLINDGFKLIHYGRVIANYYIDKSIEVTDTSKLKDLCVRIRKLKKDEYNEGFSLGNHKLLPEQYRLNTIEKEISISDEEAKQYEEMLLNNNYELIYTDDKLDRVLIKDNLVFQIQDLKNIGLTNAAFLTDSIDISDKTENYLYDSMEKYGIKVINKESVNRFNLKDNKVLSINEIIEEMKK